MDNLTETGATAQTAEQTGNTTGTVEQTGAQTATEQQSGGMSADEIRKLIQSSTDRATADLGKQIAALKKENEALKKKNMSAEEVRQLELGEREKAIADKERELSDRENRLFAIKAIKEAGLDDGSERSLALVEFVLADKQESITERVKTFQSLVKSMVDAQVEARFKSIGRTPSGAAQTGETKKDPGIATDFGKRRAAQNAQTTRVLNHYLGGKG